jgi:hypothetical protein
MTTGYFYYLGIYYILFFSERHSCKMDERRIVKMPNEDTKEISKIKEFLKQVDKKYYHRAIQNRQAAGSVFPHRGEDGRLFLNTFQYVNLFKQN